MEGKDNRSREKRYKMHQSKHQFHRKHNTGGSNSTSSAAQEANTMSGIVDIVDSSDEHYVGQRGWKGVLPQNKPRDMLLDDLDNDDDDGQSVENAQMRAGDFKIMSQMPASVGGHFKFSSEKHWDTDEVNDIFETSNASEYFTLNLKLLNAGLKSIPFYKRMDYAKSLFTKSQINKMNEDAEKAEELYQNILKEIEANPNPKIKINNTSRQSGSAKSNGSNKSVKNATSVAGDELDELLSVTTEQVAKVGLSSNSENMPPSSSLPPSTAGSVVGNKNDIQEWLDNVLDE